MAQQRAIASSYSLLGGCHVGRDGEAINFISYGISHTEDEDAITLCSRQADKVESSWNVMAHGDAREEKWRGKGRMEWEASALHTATHYLGT